MLTSFQNSHSHTLMVKKSLENKCIRACLLCKSSFWFITIIYSFWVFFEDAFESHCLEEKYHCSIYALVRTDHRRKVPVL